MKYQIILACIVIILGILWLLYLWGKSFRTTNPQICVILGSGGHTTEMCEILRNFNFDRCNKVTVITATSDSLSQSFFRNYFQSLKKNNLPSFQFVKVRRTNEVKQSKITSIATTLLAIVNVFFLIIKNLLGTSHLISNGPGICVPFFYLFWVFNLLKITQTKLIFIESWCRISSISVAGKIVARVADEFLVHWENQENMIRGSKYRGKII